MVPSDTEGPGYGDFEFKGVPHPPLWLLPMLSFSAGGTGTVPTLIVPAFCFSYHGKRNPAEPIIPMNALPNECEHHAIGRPPDRFPEPVLRHHRFLSTGAVWGNRGGPHLTLLELFISLSEKRNSPEPFNL